MIGPEFSGYKLLEKLGGGNTGYVYRAFDPAQRRYLAIKILPNDFLISKERRARFIRETRAARLLSHPAIARMLEVGTSDDGHHFIAMEYVDGRRYDEIAQAHQDGLPEETFFELMQPVLEGVAYAHEHHLVHRDLKPTNLKLTGDGQPKVLDFGLVKFLNKEPSGDDSFQTMAGMVLGSAGYMSPEQADGLSSDARTDVFSMGVIMYEFLAGRNPFQCKNPFATITKILTVNPVSLELIRPDLPLPLCQVIQKCLSKDMDMRFADAGVLLQAITQIKGG
ncbi:MAG: serine/threonine-protein kinase [Acidobacteriota bacterium]|nr:serine/threonine-protein kinase [Acidobacteriota bacterium]